MQPNEIKVGTCYRTSKNEVRCVLEITAEKRVVYKSRNSSYAKGEAGWYQTGNPSTLPLLSTFAFAAVGEVPCDWDSDKTPPPLPNVAGIKFDAAPAGSADAPKKPMPDMGPP